MKRTVREGLTPRELDVVAAWWHVGSVKGAAELLGIAEQTAKNDLWTARMRSGAPTTLGLAQMYAGRLPSLATLRRRARKVAADIMRARSTFAEVPVDNRGRRSVSGPPSKRNHNNYFHESLGLRTLVRERDCGQLGGRVHHVAHNNVERPVQSSQRRTEPSDLDGHRAPFGLEVLALPLIDRLGQVERVAVTEREPSPLSRHTGIVPQVAA